MGENDIVLAFLFEGFDQLKMTEAQRKRTLKDGQEDGFCKLSISTNGGSRYTCFFGYMFGGI